MSRYYVEEPCEVCGLYEAHEHQRTGGHFDQVGEWCDGSGGVRRELTIDYEAASGVLLEKLVEAEDKGLSAGTLAVVSSSIAPLIVDAALGDPESVPIPET